MASDVAPLAPTEVETPALPPLPVVDSDTAPPELTAPPRYAASWRERLVHLVDPGAPRKKVDGRTLVVMGRCGGLGWPCAKPQTWEVCPECAEATT